MTTAPKVSFALLGMIVMALQVSYVLIVLETYNARYVIPLNA